MKSAVRLCLISSLPALLAVPTCIAGAQSTHNLDLVVPQVQTFALTGTKDLTQQGVKMEDAEYRGRKAVRLTTLVDADIDGMALVNGTQFRDGTIEVDVASKSTRPPGVRMPGFIGIAFRTSPDLEHYELLYIRPGNSRSDDQAMRNHSVQYVSSPGYGWERLRRQWPYIYEAYAELQPEQWTHIKIDVHGRKAVLYLNGSADPSLVVDGLKGENLQGGIALWCWAEEEAYFSNLKVTNAAPDPIQNGGEAAGTWDVKYASDAGGFVGTMKLVRQGSTVLGIWSGALGPDQPVSGTWRDGYVELTFAGTWPEQPGTVTANLAGWVDGDSAKGRMKVEGRADGLWTAVREK